MSVPGSFLALLLIALAGVAQAVEFDEKVKAPRAVSGAEVKTRLAGIAARASGPNAINALDAVRDGSLARERFDARWMLGGLVDARVPLPELEESGLKPAGDGSYTIDGRTHPQWRTLEQNLVLLSDPDLLTKLEGSFTARGFRPEDTAALRGYVSEHNLKRTRDENQLSLIISASKMAKKLQKLKRLDDHFMASYFYQKEWSVAETERRWAVGLLDALEPQAQRVLASYFSELATQGFIGPAPTADAYRAEKELLLRPDFEQQAKAAFEEGKL